MAARAAAAEAMRRVREATYRGRPLGDERFVAELTEKLGRDVRGRQRGRPRKQAKEAGGESDE